jgi:hypothetical protein
MDPLPCPINDHVGGKRRPASGRAVRNGPLPRGLDFPEAKDGHWCLSIFERQVDDFLTNHGIDHEHEPKWPLHPEFNPRGVNRADWRLPDGTMGEAAGMMDDPKYAGKMEQKRAWANALGIDLLVLMPEKALILDQVFEPRLTTAHEVSK